MVVDGGNVDELLLEDDVVVDGGDVDDVLLLEEDVVVGVIFIRSASWPVIVNTPL